MSFFQVCVGAGRAQSAGGGRGKAWGNPSSADDGCSNKVCWFYVKHVKHETSLGFLSYFRVAAIRPFATQQMALLVENSAVIMAKGRRNSSAEVKLDCSYSSSL